MSRPVSLKRVTTLLFGSCLVVASIAIASHKTSDSFIGTWQLNVSKSKFAGPAPKSQTRTYEESADGMMTVTVKTVTADGKETTSSITFKADGKDYPVTGTADSISERQVDPRTAKYVYKRAGKTMAVGRRAVSKDGKTLWMTERGTDPTGAKFNDKLVYEKE